MKRITNLIILDASGSMESKRKETLEGLRTLLSQIKEDAIKDKRKVKTSTIIVEFSDYDNIKTLVNEEDSSKLDVEVIEKYRPNGGTALFDAIGYGFRKLPLGQDNVFINIFTDGEENDSKEFSGAIIKDFITMARDRNWAVTFMGASEEALETAKRLNISEKNTMFFSNNKRGVTDSLNSLSKTRSAYYTASMTTNSFDADSILQK